MTEQQLTQAPEVLEVRDQVITLLTDGGATPLTLQQAKDLADLPEYYTEVTVRLRFGDRYRANGYGGPIRLGIDTRVVASIEDTAYEEQRAVDAALRNARIEINGATTTPVLFESGDQVAEDDRKWSALTTWTTSIKNRRKQ